MKKKKPVPALGFAEDLVSQLGVAEDDPRAMRIAKISEMKRLVLTPVTNGTILAGFRRGQ